MRIRLSSTRLGRVGENIISYIVHSMICIRIVTKYVYVETEGDRDLTITLLNLAAAW